MIALLLVIACLVLLGLTKVGIRVLWDRQLSVFLKIGCFSFQILKEKKKKSKSNGKSDDKGSLKKRLLSNWKQLLRMISELLHIPSLDKLVLQVHFGGEDNADAALNYGKACAVAGALLPFVEQLFRVKEQKVDLLYHCDQKGITVQADAIVTIKIVQAFAVAAAIIKFAYMIYKENEKAVSE